MGNWEPMTSPDEQDFGQGSVCTHSLEESIAAGFSIIEYVVSHGIAYICQNIKQLLKGGKQPGQLSFNGPLHFTKKQINHDPLFMDTFLSWVQGILPFMLLMYVFSFVFMS